MYPSLLCTLSILFTLCAARAVVRVPGPASDMAVRAANVPFPAARALWDTTGRREVYLNEARAVNKREDSSAVGALFEKLVHEEIAPKRSVKREEESTTKGTLFKNTIHEKISDS
ncbi:hypothetical protein K503DRAFT_771591 [Rhizopogon vinicolor AM-OR11-026]|uniref:Secreted RxLR effector peptide protein n=1 Tax=Rhizopogon vinicolor AM-OR11-026 TaxID=1314800 RepID=A0A1B7MXL9_9AGAM|nr:hypothetical protein K503DRAFT_771591 [Rhizopogon vinicolor AM-OR11-026]